MSTNTELTSPMSLFYFLPISDRKRPVGYLMVERVTRFGCEPIDCPDYGFGPSKASASLGPVFRVNRACDWMALSPLCVNVCYCGAESNGRNLIIRVMRTGEDTSTDLNTIYFHIQYI